jgi:hypothetical protein
MDDKNLYQEIDIMFEEYLSSGETPKIIIKDMKKNSVLKIDYKKILFDSNLNIYKIEDNKAVPVSNADFKAFVVKK